MIIVTENTEERLVKALNTIKEKRSNHRCIHFRFSNIESLDLPQTCETIDEYIGDPKGYIIVCEDKDIFVIANGISYKLFESLTEYFLAQANTPASQEGELASLFDVEKNWLGLIELAEGRLNKKLGIEKATRDKANAIKKEKQRQSALNIPVDENLVATIDKRRTEREELEILFVEDDPFSRELLNSSVGKDFGVALAEDGQGGIMSYVTKAPDIIFLDIEMPDITGHDVLQKILEMDEHAFVVMLSGKGSKENVMQAVENGAKGFVGKPFTKDKLLAYIEKCPKAQHLETIGA